MTWILLLSTLAFAQVHAPTRHVLGDGTPVTWIQDESSQRSYLVWSLARGSAGSHSAETLDLLMKSLGEGTLSHRGPRWRWALGQIGARVDVGVTPFRFWVWLEAPVGSEDQAMELLAEMLNGPQLRTRPVHREIRQRRTAQPFRSQASISTQARQRWLEGRGCPVEPLKNWESLPRMGWWSRLRQAHQQLLRSGAPGLTIVGPRGPEDLAEGLAYLDGLGGELTPLECSIEGDSELYEAQIIVVDHPGSQALLRSIQPLGPGEDAAQRQVLWALMEGYSSRVGTAVRSESGLSYASWARLVEIPGMRFAELELGVELERAVEALLLVEEVLQRSIEEGLGPEEMEMARLQVQQSRLRQAMEPWDVVAWASWSQHLDTPLDVLEEQWSPPVLTSARVNSALKEIGSTDRRTWVIVGSVDTIAPALERAGLTIDQLWESENLWQEPEGSTK